MIRRKNGQLRWCILATIFGLPTCPEITMKRHKLFIPLFVLAALAGCGKSVPQEKLSYVGEWQEPTMYLLITKDDGKELIKTPGSI